MQLYSQPETESCVSTLNQSLEDQYLPLGDRKMASSYLYVKDIGMFVSADDLIRYKDYPIGTYRVRHHKTENKYCVKMIIHDSPKFLYVYDLSEKYLELLVKILDHDLDGDVYDQTIPLVDNKFPRVNCVVCHNACGLDLVYIYQSLHAIVEPKN